MLLLPLSVSKSLFFFNSCKSRNASIGEDCSNAWCTDENSECVDNGGSRTCACASKYMWTGASCILGPTGVKTVTNLEYNVDPVLSNNFDETIDLDLLSSSTTWQTEVKVAPGEGLQVTEISSTSYKLSLRYTPTRMQTFLLVVTAQSDQFQVQEILTVRIRPPPVVLNILLINGAPRGSLLAELGLSAEAGERFMVETGDGTVDALFAVSAEGRVECGQDISLDGITNVNTLAHEYNFNVSLNRSSDVEQVAEVNILVFRDHFQSSVKENLNGVIVRYFLSPNDNFFLNPTNVPAFADISQDGESISLDYGVDYDAQDVKIIGFDIDLKTRDESQTSSIAVELTIIDENDSKPKLVTNINGETTSNDFYAFDVLPGPSGTVVGVVTSQDRDTVGTVSYRLQGQHQNSFTVDSKGVVRSTVPLRRSVFGTQFSLYVTADDGVQQSDAVEIIFLLSSMTTLDRNLNMTFTGSLIEEGVPDQFVTSVRVSNYTNFNFTNFLAFNMFHLNGSTGEVRTMRPLDREKDRTPTDFSVQAVLDTEDQCQRVILGLLEVTITDINDNSPKFADTQYNATMTEETPNGVYIPDLNDIEVFDEDEGPNANLTFSLSGPDSKYFSVSSSGNKNRFSVTTSSKPVDLESLSSNTLTFNIIAVDNPVDISTRLSSSVKAVITVEDVNDFTPEFTGSSVATVMNENSPAATVATLTATDGDKTDNNISYQLVFGGSGFFQIDTTDGVLRTTKMLDRETIDKFFLTIHAVDTGTPRNTGSTTVTVEVGDVNDNKPRFSDTYRLTVQEETCTGVSLQVSASDADEGSNGQVRYSSSDSHFTVSVDGHLQCQRALDYEQNQSYSISVVATDNGTPSLNETVTVEVVVEGINDNTPEFDESSYSTKLSTGEWFSNRPILVIGVNDEDFGSFGEINPLSLTNHGDIFVISGRNTGVLRVNPTASKPISDITYTFNVKAEDLGGNTREVTVTIEVESGDDSNVQFNKYEYSFSMEEETNYSSRVIGNVSLYNPGVDVYYSIISESDFIIDNKTGEITCVNKLDRETKAHRVFIVRAQETALSGGNSRDLTLVNVTIVDKNDNSPIFTRSESSYLFDISEDAAINQAVAVVEATDADDGVNSKLEYSIVSQSSPDFQMDQTSGTISVSRGLDREHIDQYILVIKVSDMGNTTRRSATMTVTIGVLDINDVTPHFDRDTIAIILPEDQQLYFSVRTVSAIDEDFGDNATVTYRVQSSSSCPLNVSNKGEISLSSQLDYETVTEHMCVVLAMDRAGSCPSGCPSQRTGSTTISLSVDDVNDNPPRFINHPYAANVSRSAPLNELVTDKVMAVDDDSLYGNGLVKYFILSEQDYFHIDIDSGEITVASSLNNIEGDTYRLTIEARDTSNETNLRTPTTVDISIIPDQDLPFFNVSYSVTVTEHAERGSHLLTKIQAYVTRTEGTVRCDFTNNCEYSITRTMNYDPAAFIISSETGELRLNNTELDRDVGGSNAFITVQVIDKTTGKSRETRVTVTINDINDNLPFFENFTATFIVSHSADVDTIFATLTSMDKDKEHNPVYTLSVLSDKDDLKIGVKENGSLYVKESLLSTNGTITFDVNVRDGKPIQPSRDTTFGGPSQQRINVEVRDDNYNEHAPVFIKGEYEGTIYALALAGSSVIVEDLRAVDADNHTVFYDIQTGNVRDTFVINSSSAELFLRFNLDDSIPSKVNLHVIAVDEATPPRTGTCLVVVQLTNQAPVQCIRKSEYDTLTVERQQRTIFLSLFIVLAVLLTAAVIYAIVVTYKWRKSVSRGSHYGENIRNARTEKGERTRYDGLEGRDQQTGYDGFETSSQDFSAGVRNPGYVAAGTSSAGPRCSPPDIPLPRRTEPEPDYDDN